MQPVRILLVDDSSDFLNCAASFLAAQPNVEIVGVAHSGREAIRLVEMLTPDLVVMDLVMPEMNGLEATRRIKEKLHPPCIIMASLHDTSEYRQMAKTAGADEMISKDKVGQALFPTIQRYFPTALTTETIAAKLE